MVNLKRTGLALAILFLAQLFFFSPTTHAMSLKSCDYAYTDSTYKKISQSCEGGLVQDGTFNYKSGSGTTAVYTLTTSISGGNTLNTKCTTTITVNKNVLKSGKISGSTPFGNFCDTVASENIVIDLAQSNASIQTDAGNKVLHNKLDSLISGSCNGLGSADAISSCATRGKAAIDTCGPAALNAANQAATVGGAGTDPSAVYLANLLPCLNNATGIQQSELAKALGGNIYAEVSDASNNAAVVEDCVIDPNTGKCESEDKDKTTCNIDNIGWIICPVMNFMAGIVDAAYDWIADLLTVQPIVTNGTGTNLYQAWQIMRNFANVMFVMGFLLIIYSQITGMGVSNYGIKKLLPKLIVAAILVNVSYWVCSIAVDLSNIAGTGLNSLFENLKGTLGSPELNNGAFDENSGTGWAGITGLVLAGVVTGGVVALAGVSILLPALIAALIAIVTVFLVLTLRQALIILLIVISPLAFVALLLPNTEEWFKKWRSLFQTLLLMFPIISVIFGASAFAAEIVMKTSTTFAVQIMGALITILPLAITPIVMKTAGGVLNRFAGYINNPNKGPFDRMKKGAENYRAKRQDINRADRLNGTSMFGRRASKWKNSDSRFANTAGTALGAASRPGELIAGGIAGRGLTKARQAASAKASADFAEQNYVATRAADESSGYAQKIAGPTGSPSLAQAYAIEAIEKEKANDRAAEKTIFEHNGTSFQDLGTGIKSGAFTGARAEAAVQRYFETANSDGVQDMLEHINSMRSNPALEGDALNHAKELTKVTGDALANSPLKPVNLSASNLGRLRNGEAVLDEAARIASTVAEGKINANSIGKMDIDEIRRWTGNMSNNGTLLAAAEPSKIEATRQAIIDAENDVRINVNFGDREKEGLAQLKAQLEAQLAVANSDVGKKARQDVAASTYGKDI